MPLAIRNLTKARTPRLPYRQLAERILGKRYELSVVLIGNARARTLNRAWRSKNYPANILTFPLDRNLGEIFLNLDQTSGLDLQFLFIHGLLHLKGLTHGSRMERLENENYAQSHHHRTGRRHHLGQGCCL